MRSKGLLVATVLLAVLGGLVWWSNKNKKDEPAPGAAAGPKLLTLAEASITRVEIRHREAETTRIERDGSGWKITSPQPFPSDKDAVNSLLSALTSVSADKVVEEKPADLAPFGLKEPGSVVTITLKNGQSRTLKLGDDAPVGGGAYTQVDGDARVFTLASFTRSSIDKLAVDLRDKRILPFDADNLVRIELAAKGPAIEFARNARNEWAILKPSPMRADNWQIDELLRKLKDLKLDPLLTSDQQADLARQFQAAAPLATVTVTDAAGPHKLEIRRTKDNKYYARGSAIEGCHLLAEDNGKGFDKTAADFRNKKLFDFGFSDPAKVEYKDAARQLSFSKSGEKWMANLKAMDPVGVQSLIDRLRDLSADSFPDSGFTTPAIELSVTSKTTERISISKSGDKFIARREGEPALYHLDAKSVEDLQKAAADVKEEPKAAKK